VSRGSRVQILFVDLDLEASELCRYDFVQLYDGPNSAARSLGKSLTSKCQRHINTVVKASPLQYKRNR
jgi:hypothetical protein